MEWDKVYRIAWYIVQRSRVKPYDRECVVQEAVLTAWKTQRRKGGSLCQYARYAAKSEVHRWAARNQSQKRSAQKECYLTPLGRDEKGWVEAPDYAAIETLIENRLPEDRAARRAAQEKRRYRKKVLAQRAAQ